MSGYKSTWYDEESKRFEFEVYVYNVYLEDDLYEIGRRGLTKNGLVFEPKKEYLAEQREIEKNKKYDVIFRIGSNRYSMRKATKSEINARHSELQNKRRSNSMGHPQVGPSKNYLKKNGTIPLDWHKDVKILQIYE